MQVVGSSSRNHHLWSWNTICRTHAPNGIFNLAKEWKISFYGIAGIYTPTVLFSTDATARVYNCNSCSYFLVWLLFCMDCVFVEWGFSNWGRKQRWVIPLCHIPSTHWNFPPLTCRYVGLFLYRPPIGRPPCSKQTLFTTHLEWFW